MAFTSLKWLALIAVWPFGGRRGVERPVSIAAIRRTPKRSSGPSLFDLLHDDEFRFPYRRFLSSTMCGSIWRARPFCAVWRQDYTYQTLFLVSLVIEILLLPLLWFLREGVEATDEGLKIAPREARYQQENLWNSMCLTVRDSLRETVRLFTALCTRPDSTGSWFSRADRVPQADLHADELRLSKVRHPRTGDGAPIGRLWAINSILIISLSIRRSLTQRFSAYKMVTLGAIISAASVFIMVCPRCGSSAGGRIRRPLLGHGYLGLHARFIPIMS